MNEAQKGLVSYPRHILALENGERFVASEDGLARAGV